MPFIGINPPTNRVQGIYGSTPTATALGSYPLIGIVDASAQATPGLVAWYKDNFGRISILAYAQAGASIPVGAPLAHQAGFATTLNSAGVSTQNGIDTGFVLQTTTAQGGRQDIFAGVAAANVSNTGYFFWRYVSGYVPQALVGSIIASGNMLVVSGSTAGQLGSNTLGNATTTGTTYFPVGYMLQLASNAAGTIASIWLNGWYA